MIRRACAENLSAEGMIARVLGSVNAYRGNTPQSDDMTLVVLRVL
jgi:serine phosphatase RsbU (regulator of sigma subunit)